MIRIEFNDHDVNAALTRLGARMGDMTDVMQEIGEALAESTEARFAAGTTPEGTAWTPKSAATLAKYARGKKTADTRPLHYTLALLQNIYPQAGADFVEIGSGEPYAAMMQFGGQKEKFPHLWGDIPARPFLGISEDDRAAILEIVGEWFERAAGGAP